MNSHPSGLHPFSFRLPQLLLATSLLWLGGCAAWQQTPYHRPDASVPTQWQQPTTAATAAPLAGRWWQAFADPQLDSLIEQVLQRNPDLAKAALTLKKARLQANLTETNLLPTPSASLSASRSRPLDQAGGSTTSAGGSAGLSYELDLWGKLARERDASRWEAEATAQDREASALTLIGTAASAYWQIAYLNQAISLSESSLADTQRLLALAQSRYQAGAIGGLDRVQAEQSVASQQATLLNYQRERDAQRYTLSLLLDQAPTTQVPERASLDGVTIPEVAAGVPASVLAHRPDLKASEQRLREQLATLDATRLEMYPALSLTATATTSSTALSQLLSNPVGSLGAGLTLPFVNWQTHDLNNQVQQVTYEAAVIDFRKSLYTAFSEVETALNAGNSYRRQADWLTQALQLAQENERLNESRYRNGASDLQDWLTAQTSRRTAALAVAENQLNRLNNRMTLLQALGGGDGSLFAGLPATK